MSTWNRRKTLQTLLASGAVSVLRPTVTAFAQSATLLRAKKQALVIGNSKYREMPLRNPVNDAQGIAAVLKSSGFDVKLALDLSQAEMREAIRGYGQSLSETAAVGLFYFAGHGVQVAWRNYLIPVDAEITNIEELRDRAVDLNNLIAGIRKAGNPMNLIILDACRDNPFRQLQLEQKGLSQLDAPPGTLLAYATAPGNTAIDGDGANGLYTEHLLREIKVPGLKVEDVFKRVRLSVRRYSNGLQVPWESTSLEEDFWFVPPAQIKRPTANEAEKEFNQELALWERIKDAKDPAAFEDYLRRFPSGSFSEIAQFNLDRILAARGERKIEALDAPGNPFSKGTGFLNLRFQTGDRFQYRELDMSTGAEKRTLTHRVTEITDTEVVFNNRRFATDLLGNSRRQADGDTVSQSQIYIPEYSVGKKWGTRYRIVKVDGRILYGEWVLKVVGREMTKVPAGTFNAFHVVGRGWGEEAGSQLHQEYWIVPELGRHIAREYRRISRNNNLTRNEREELISYSRRG